MLNRLLRRNEHRAHGIEFASDRGDTFFGMLTVFHRFFDAIACGGCIDGPGIFFQSVAELPQIREKRIECLTPLLRQGFDFPETLLQLRSASFRRGTNLRIGYFRHVRVPLFKISIAPSLHRLRTGTDLD